MALYEGNLKTGAAIKVPGATATTQEKALLLSQVHLANS